MIKSSQILFKQPKESVYQVGKRVDPAVLILLFGQCKMKLN